MPDPKKLSSPGLYEDFFCRQSWPEPWDESESSPDQRRMKIRNRVRNKPSKSRTERFLEYFMHQGPSWPWGYFIYRTAYGSDEDWNRALAKLHRHIHYTIRHQAIQFERDPEQIKDTTEAVEIVWEGCQNVIVEHRKLLEGASPTKVRQLFKEWLERQSDHDYDGFPRSSYCLMIDDHAMRSILVSSEPSQDPRDRTPKQPGYVILIDRSFPDKGGLRHEPYNVGWMRLTMGGAWKVWQFASTYDDLEFEDVYPNIGRPGLIPYYDGHLKWVEDVNGQEVKNPSHSENEEEEDEDDDEDGYTEEGGYPFHDIYEYLREKGHI